MTILTINRKEFEKQIGKLTPELEKKITDMGTPIEEVTDSEIAIEVFPNRPDLLSLENFARAINQFIGKGKIAKFKVVSSGEKLIVDKSLPKEWPYAIACIIKGIKFDDEKIKQIIDVQEKLGMSVLRKRKRGGIGLYPLEKIEFPIKFVGMKPEEIKFRPLEFPREITGRQILRQHPTGREYADICKDWNSFPVFVDDSEKIMSMPPIINSHDVGKIDETTSDVFLEATGDNLPSLQNAFNIIVTSLASMGGQIYSIDCKQQNGKMLSIPDLSSEELNFKIEDIEKTLGIKLKEKEVRGYLARMGIDYENKKGKSVALIPAYRTDILHWVDLAEEVAIAYGYENFEPEIPAISTIAEENPIDKTKKAIGNILAGLGCLECSSFHLITKKDVKKMHYEFNNFIEVEASKTGRDVLRMDLMTNMLQILSKNSDVAYPQKIFEMGRVFELDEKSETGVIEKERLSIAMIDEKMGFTEMKQVLDYLFKMLDVEYKLEDVEDSNYIVGRCGKILVGNEEVGRVGEIAPRVLKNWKIRMPVVGCEMGLGFLFG
ncbi:phenylalanine--tRNA ligase subunit beta [archaeon]|nr:phenylalanine--tRNA ligase subunit beta [archaeon]